MSGISLASGVRLGSQDNPDPLAATTDPRLKGEPIWKRLFHVSIIQLQLATLAIILPASGVVPIVDVIFPPIAWLYLTILAIAVFPHKGTYDEPPSVLHSIHLARAYSILGHLIGLLLPVSLVLGAFVRRDNAVLESAAPHLFLHVSQTLTESVMHAFVLGSLPVRAFTPLVFNARRLPTAWVWVRTVMTSAARAYSTEHSVPERVIEFQPETLSTVLKAESGAHTLGPVNDWMHGLLQKVIPFHLPAPVASTTAWVWYSRALAIANFVFATANLLFLLLPVFVPRAIVKHYELVAAARVGHRKGHKEQ